MTRVPAATLGFWIVKILCATLGETMGDFLDKPVACNPILAAMIIVLIALLPQRAGQRPDTISRTRS
nr:hypothetical protein [Sphingomonas chungangi]